MKSQFVKAFGAIQELFTELSDQGKITPDQATKFDDAQKTIIGFSSWVDNQLNPVLKIELPWDNEEFIKAWDLWKKHHKERSGKNYKTIGEQSALKRLVGLSDGQMDKAIAILKHSREMDWAGFHLPQNFNSQNSPQKNQDYKQNLFNRLTKQQ